MRLRYACLCILIFTIGAAAAQGGFSIQQSFGTTSGIEDDFFNSTFPGFDMDMSFPDFGFEFNTTSSYNSSQAYSFFREYYVGTPVPIVGIVSTPVRFDLTHRMPSDIYFGGHKVAYSKYTSAVASNRGNELWIQGALDWSSYVMCPIGSGLQLIAFAPSGGNVDFYKILQTNTLNTTYKRYQFYSGYNNMNYVADTVGRHILLFVLNGQPSNAIIIDVTPAPQQTQIQQPQTQGSAYQGSSSYTQTYGQQYNQQSGQQQYSQQYTSTPVPAPVPVPAPASISGDVPVTIKSNGMRGYQVYLDEVYIGKETRGDGSFSFAVTGNMYHDIRVFDGQFNYPKRMYFQSGVPKIINVEPGTAVYV